MVARRIQGIRVVSLIAATVISLACGTNYGYSAWAPQFAAKLGLSSTEINLIGTAGNLGMYASGIPIGILIDARGPRFAVILGALCLGIGYYPIYGAFVKGRGSMGVPLLCFFSTLTGLGSCSAFFAALKTSAMNWPTYRGTATAFPMAGFGLSAFLFSAVSSLAFPEDTSDLLLLLTLGTCGMVSLSCLFLRIVHHPQNYASLPTDEGNPHIESRQLRPSKSFERRRPDMDQGSYESSSNMNEAVQHPHESQGLDRGNHGVVHDRFKVSKQNLDENSSLMSDSPISNQPSNAHFLQEHSRSHVENSRMQPPDVRGLALLIKEEFWYLFSLLGILAGIGLMTINNVGNDTQALWSHYDDSVSQKFIQKRQFVHVSLISLSSFTGRLSSGVGSDIIKKMLGMSRYWCVTLAAVVFAAAQICAIRIENPHHLYAVSTLTGFAYGVIFGVYPTLVAEAFGIHGLSQNWGCMCLAAILFGNIFNLIYGTVYDHHSSILPSGERDCSEGLYCYRTAYWVTFIGSLLALCVSLWGIHRERERERERERGSKKVNVNLEHHDGDV